MIRLQNLLAAALLGACLFTAAPTQAAEPQYTASLVNDMHCAACAKKISDRLYLVGGVSKVSANVEKHAAFVFPEGNANPSPKAMWEAVEAAGFKPIKLAGPQGVFQTKPTF